MPARKIQRGFGDGHRFLVTRRWKKIRADLRSHGFQLLNGRRAIYVAAHQKHFFLAVFGQPFGELAAGGGFAGALQSGHQNDRWRRGGEIQIVVRLAHQRDQLAMHHAHHGLTRRETAHHFLSHGFFANARDKVAHHRQCDVGFEQRHAHFAQRFADIVFGEARFAAQRF